MARYLNEEAVKALIDNRLKPAYEELENPHNTNEKIIKLNAIIATLLMLKDHLKFIEDAINKPVHYVLASETPNGTYTIRGEFNTEEAAKTLINELNEMGSYVDYQVKMITEHKRSTFHMPKF